jgi:hypothetical protein
MRTIASTRLKGVLVGTAALLFLALGIGGWEVVEPMPDHAPVFLDETAKTYIAPPCLTAWLRKSTNTIAALSRSTAHEAHELHYRPDPDCRDANAFAENRSIIGIVLESLGLIPPPRYWWDAAGGGVPGMDDLASQIDMDKLFQKVMACVAYAMKRLDEFPETEKVYKSHLPAADAQESVRARAGLIWLNRAIVILQVGKRLYVRAHQREIADDELVQAIGSGRILLENIDEPTRDDFVAGCEQLYKLADTLPTR